MRQSPAGGGAARPPLGTPLSIVSDALAANEVPPELTMAACKALGIALLGGGGAPPPKSSDTRGAALIGGGPLGFDVGGGPE